MAVSRKAMTEGIRTSTFRGTLNKARFYNPSVSRLRETREPAPFTQGSLWVLPHPLRGEPEGVRLGRPTHGVGRRKHRGKAEKHAYLKFTFTFTVYV